MAPQVTPRWLWVVDRMDTSHRELVKLSGRLSSEHAARSRSGTSAMPATSEMNGRANLVLLD